MKRLIVVSLLTAAMLLVGGTLSPPTATSAEPTLATSIDEIAGTWYRESKLGGGRYYVRFDKDGTAHWALVVDQLDSAPLEVHSCEFEGTEMVIKRIKAHHSMPPCDEIGRYQVQLLDGGNIRIVVIEDRCTVRAVQNPEEYQPAR